MNAPGALIAAAGRLSLEKTTCDAEFFIAVRKENISTGLFKQTRTTTSLKSTHAAMMWHANPLQKRKQRHEFFVQIWQLHQI
ncbi:hypothetical protein GQ607_009443 [Colletotrichum asianum]|uniref:Uncharacterized protein n=1 Tax=Colletotrichum asianum TaxID=702518 RepID=A0A8H3WBJ0_9PEZI|nr:hypothetical protein GQ607_009443 [Colletotrichum asianum]